MNTPGIQSPSTYTFLNITPRMHATDAIIPITIDDMVNETSAGVIATDHYSTTYASSNSWALPLWPKRALTSNYGHSSTIGGCCNESLEALVAAAPAEPALNPNQTNHRNTAPKTLCGILCGS